MAIPSTRVSLFKRRSVWYLSYWLHGERVRESTGLELKGDAEFVRADLERKLVLGRLQHLKQRVMPAAQAYRDYLRDARARFKSAKTITTDRYVLKSFFRWASLKTIDQFTTKTVMDYMAYKVKVDKLVITSIRRLRETLHAFFNFAKRAGCIAENPVTPYKAPKMPEREIRFLKAGQIEGCLKAIKGHRLEALIACAIFAGLRREELCWLTWDDVDLNEAKPLLRVRAKDIDGQHWHPKNKKNRRIPISRRLYGYLVALRIQQGGKPWVFLSPEGCRWDPDNLGHDREELMASLKLPWTFLDFRHTFGSHLAMKGVSLAKIAKLMGNTVRVVEMHYASLQPEEMQQEVEFMEPIEEAPPVRGRVGEA